MSSPEGPRPKASLDNAFETRLGLFVKEEEDPAQVAGLLLEELENGTDIPSLQEFFLSVAKSIESMYAWREYENPHGKQDEKLPAGSERHQWADDVVANQAQYQMLKFSKVLVRYADSLESLEKENTTDEERSHLRHQAWKYIDRAKHIILKNRDDWYDKLFKS